MTGRTTTLVSKGDFHGELAARDELAARMGKLPPPDDKPFVSADEHGSLNVKV